MNKILKKNNKKKSIAIFGASGFIGRNLVDLLSKNGWTIKALMRNPHYASYLLPMGDVGQVYLKSCNILDYNSVLEATKNIDYVVNLVGILFQTKNQRFHEIHIKGAENIAKACQENDIKRLLHVSALGIRKGSLANYSRSKFEGELRVKSVYKKSIILRPSVVFGLHDNFINKFAQMVSIFPVLPLIGGGLTRFQPVYIKDLTNLIEYLSMSRLYKGKTFELGGLDIFTLKELFDLIVQSKGIKRRYIPVPFAITKLIGMACSFLPNPPITVDQVRLLQEDNITSNSAFEFKQLGIVPVTLEAYLNKLFEN